MYSKTRKYLEDFDNQHDFERMCADILNSLGYRNVVLMAPRGGSDGGKDITFTTYGGDKGLACVTLRKDIDVKYQQDFSQRKPGEFQQYFLFCTTYLTSSQKVKYAKHCLDKLNAEFVAVDVEALRSLLDTTLIPVRSAFLYVDEQAAQRGDIEDVAIYQVEGRRAFDKAKDAPDWETEMTLTLEAMKHYPAVRPQEGRRRHLALRMSQAISERFTDDHETRHLAADPLRLLELRKLYDPGASASSTIPPLTDTIEWLEAALAEGEDSEGDVLASLALSYGVSRTWDKMIAAIEKSLAVNLRWKAYFSEPKHLIMLVYAWENQLDRLQVLGRLLDITLPEEEPTVLDLIQNLDLSRPHGPFFVDWFVLLQPTTQHEGQDAAEFPAPLRIFKLSDSEGDQATMARCQLSRTAGYSSFNPGPDERMPLADLIAELSRQFLFVCRASVD